MEPWTDLDGSTYSMYQTVQGGAAAGAVKPSEHHEVYSPQRDHQHAMHAHSSPQELPKEERQPQFITLPPGVSIDALTLDSEGQMVSVAKGADQQQPAPERETYDSKAAEHGGGDDEQSLGGSSQEMQCRCATLSLACISLKFYPLGFIPSGSSVTACLLMMTLIQVLDLVCLSFEQCWNVIWSALLVQMQ
jgi:hypothetical protein